MAGFLDLAEAFDGVDHTILLRKSTCYRVVDGAMLSSRVI